MWWTITYRVIASVVTFLVGWAVFAIMSPAKESRLSPSTRQVESITLRRLRCPVAVTECQALIATFRSDGTCNFVTYDHGHHESTFTGDFNPQSFTPIIEHINRQGPFELPLVSPASPGTETTTIEVVTSNGTRLVASYDWATRPLDLADCNIY
jgi:hypothetical protein